MNNEVPIDVFAIISGVLNLIFILIILRRLRLISRHTKKTTGNPISNSLAEARIKELTKDKNGALQEYYRCYILMDSDNLKEEIIDGKRISIEKITAKIEELGGIHPRNIFSTDIKPE